MWNSLEVTVTAEHSVTFEFANLDIVALQKEKQRVKQTSLLSDIDKRTRAKAAKVGEDANTLIALWK